MRSPVSDIERLRMRRQPTVSPLMRQRWRRLGYLHWSVDPAALAPLLPPGLEVDTWQGKAFVGLVPFTVERSRASFLPPIPGLSSFHQLGLRTYVHRDGHEPGVLFFSLDATSRVAVWGARAAYKLPFFHAVISMREDPRGRTFFRSERSATTDARFACCYESTWAAAETRLGSLEFFLVERYLHYSWDGTYLRSARVWHRPVPVTGGRIVGPLGQDLLASAHIEIAAGSEPLVHYAHEVDARIYPPALVQARAPRRLEAPARSNAGEFAFPSPAS